MHTMIFEEVISKGQQDDPSAWGIKGITEKKTSNILQNILQKPSILKVSVHFR